MRTQHEILEKIDEVSKMFKSKQSPLYLQYRVLVHKLSWDNAKKFLKPEDQTEEQKLEWEKTNHLEKKYIMMELNEQVDMSCMLVQDEDPVGCMGSFMVIFILIWLLGPTKEKLLKILWVEFSSPLSAKVCFENVFVAVCNEFGIDWERLKLRYPKKEKSSIILPTNQEGEMYGNSNPRFEDLE